MYKSINILVIIIFCFFSCNKNKVATLETIKVNVEKKYSKGDFEDYFSSSTIIPLETNNNSIFSNIDRLSVFDKKFFILDKRIGSVILFDDKGKFLNKIHNKGNGPGEYNVLIDFAIDTDKKQLILLTFAPKKILIFNFKGEFIKEIKMKKKGDFYHNVNYANNKLLFLDKNRDKLFREYDLQSGKNNGLVEMNENDKFFSNLGSRFPFMTKSNNSVNISSLYSDEIYAYDNGEIYPKYKIDFGEQRIPNDIIGKINGDFDGIYKYIKTNNYGFGISNFRENKNFITFNFWDNMIVIYSKTLKEAKAYRSFISPIDHFFFDNYIAHDGNDNNLISIYEASSFKKQMSYFKEDSAKWKQIPKYIKDFSENIKDVDNPLLIIYKFK